MVPISVLRSSEKVMNLIDEVKMSDFDGRFWKKGAKDLEKWVCYDG